MPLTSLAQDEITLCRASESVVFSCSIGAKKVSLCSPAAPPKRLVYRFGRPGRIELAHAENSAAEPSFSVATLPLCGGGGTTVSFTLGRFTYSLYSKLERSHGDGTVGGGGVPEFEDGLTVSRVGRDKKAPGKTQFKTHICDDGGAGFRESVNWLPTSPPPARAAPPASLQPAPAAAPPPGRRG